MPEAENYYAQVLRLHEVALSMFLQHITQKTAASALHSATEETLLDLRDGISTGVATFIASSLTTIHTLTSSMQRSLIHMSFGVLFFLLVCCCVTQVLITRPARWIYRKLQALRQSDLTSDTPTFRTRELPEVSELLIAFSDHLAQIYATTQTLTERSAEKRDLEEIMRSVFYLSLDVFWVWNQQRLERTSTTRLVRFSVHDSGIGMTGKQLSTIFQPFVQGDAYTTRKYGGTGLGLMIGKILVEAMGGNNSVTSTVGRGSHFPLIFSLM